jgi:hypothetical protein
MVTELQTPLPTRHRFAGAAERENPVTPDPPRAERVYLAYAAVYLVATLSTGAWMRGVFVLPELLGPFSLGHAVHAHSHLAFFGWTNLALFALLTRVAALRTRWLGMHAHLAGLASAAAFVTFLQGGYSTASIVLSAVHVGLWVAFAAAFLPAALRREGEVSYAFLLAVTFLLLAGAGAVVPTVLRVAGVSDPVLSRMSVQLFLTPFLVGWLQLGGMAAVYRELGRPRHASLVMVLLVLGCYPSMLVHLRLEGAAAWVVEAGRAGTAALGVAALLFALDALREQRPAPLLRVVAVAALIKAGVDLSVAAGYGLELISARNATVAYLHLVLLGLVTPALLWTALRVERAPRRVALYAAGAGAMVAALGALAVPGALAVLTPYPGAAGLIRIAAVAGVVTAIAGAALLTRPAGAEPRRSGGPRGMARPAGVR